MSCPTSILERWRYSPLFFGAHCMKEIQIPQHNKQTNVGENYPLPEEGKLLEWVCVGGAGRWQACREGLMTAGSSRERDNQIKFCSFPCPLCSLRTHCQSHSLRISGSSHWGWCPQENYQTNTEAWLGIGIDENM